MGCWLAILAAVPFVPELDGAPTPPPRLPVEARLKRPLPNDVTTSYLPTAFVALPGDGTDQVGSLCTAKSPSGMVLRADGLTARSRVNVIFVRHASPLQNLEASEWSSPGIAEALAVAVTGGFALPAVVSRYGRKVPVECRPVSRAMRETLRSDCRYATQVMWCIEQQAIIFGADDPQVKTLLYDELARRTRVLRDAWHRAGPPEGFEVITHLDGSRARVTIRNRSTSARAFDTSSCGAVDADGVPFRSYFGSGPAVLLAPNEVRELWLWFSEPIHLDAPALPLLVGLGKTCEHGFIVVQ